MPLTFSREDIYASYSISQLSDKKQYLVDTLNSSSLSEYEMMEINNLITTINQRIQLMNELLG